MFLPAADDIADPCTSNWSVLNFAGIIAAKTHRSQISWEPEEWCIELGHVGRKEVPAENIGLYITPVS